jgi:hypothetical protein
MELPVRVIGYLLLGVGMIAILGFDILSSIWLYNEHGLIWVVIVWVLFVPLFIIPFLAGYGIPYAIALGVAILGQVLIGASDAREEKRARARWESDQS